MSRERCHPALFQLWNFNRFQNPISLARSEIMRVSKVSAQVTYLKVLHDLHALGYIQYQPSNSPFKGSVVYMLALDTAPNNLFKKHTGDEPVADCYPAKICTGDEPVTGRYPPEICTGTELVVVPSINNINILNNQTGKTPTRADVLHADDVTPAAPATTAGAEGTCPEIQPDIPGDLNEVIVFFSGEKSTPHEAEKFYHYYCSIGWRVGGRTPMKDWKAAARFWLRKDPKFNSPTTATQNKLQTVTRKNYDEPL